MRKFEVYVYNKSNPLSFSSVLRVQILVYVLDSWKRNGGRHITQFFVLVGHQSVHGVLQAAHIEPCSGPPQPSMVFRYLRMLEGVSPALALTHTACQASAKAFVATRRSH